MSDEKTSVEPAGEAISESQLPPAGATAASAASEQSAGGSATMDLKAAMMKLPPAKPEPSSAQRASASAVEQLASESQTGTTGPIGDPGKPADTQTASSTVQRTSESALESFRQGLRSTQTDKQKKIDNPVPESIEPEAPVIEPKAGDATAAKPADAAPTGDEAPVTEEEIQKTIDDPAISKRHQKRMIHLANQAKELREKLAVLEAKPQTDATDEKMKKLEEERNQIADELVKYRHRYALESDPEIKKYDEIVVKSDEAIFGKLKEAGITEGTVKLIKDMGGFEAFSRSNAVFTIPTKDADGEVVDRKMTAAQLTKQWLNDMNMADSEYIRTQMGERYRAMDAKEKTKQEKSAKSAEWFAAQQKQYEEAVAAQQKAAEDYRSGYKRMSDEFMGKQEWAKEKQIPANATAEEKADIAAHNKAVVEARTLFEKALAPESLQAHVAVVEEAATAKYLRLQNERLTKELANARQLIDRARGGTSTTGKPGGGSISRAPAPKPDTSAAAQLKTSAAQSLQDAMEAMQAGRQ